MENSQIVLLDFTNQELVLANGIYSWIPLSIYYLYLLLFVGFALVSILLWILVVAYICQIMAEFGNTPWQRIFKTATLGFIPFVNAQENSTTLFGFSDAWDVVSITYLLMVCFLLGFCLCFVLDFYYNQYKREQLLTRMNIEFPYEAQSLCDSETLDGIEAFERTMIVCNLIKMIAELYVNEKCPHVECKECPTNNRCEVDPRWFNIYRTTKIMTLIDSLFTVTVGTPVVAKILRSDFEKDFKGIELFAVQWCAYIFVKGKGVKEAGADWYDAKCAESYKYKAESLEVLETIHDLSTDYMSLLNSPFGKKLVGLASLLICIPALNKLGMTPRLFEFSEEFEKQLRFDYSKISGISLPGVIVESTSFLAIKMTNMMMACRKFGYAEGIRSLFVSQHDFQTFDREFMWLKKNHKNFSCSTETVKPDGSKDPFTLEGYFMRCEKAIDLCDKILPSMKADPYARNRLERCKYDILNYQSDCSAEMRAGESRPFPYAVMLTGPPSVGKSMIKDIIFNQMYATDNRTGRFELKYDPQFIYTYNPTDDFYSGFKTSHTGILLDDVAQKHPKIIVANAGDDLNDLIRIINSIPFLPNQAELEKKGKTPMRVRYVVGTTNTPDLSAFHVFNCPSAVYRRMLFVNCRVKKEYQDIHGVGLKGDISDPNNLDLWDFSIDRYFPDEDRGFKLTWDGTKWSRNVSQPMDIMELSMFINDDLTKHWDKQERAKNAYNNLINLGTCEHGIAKATCHLCKNIHTAESAGEVYNVACGLMAIPVYLFLMIGTLHVYVYPKHAISRPVWGYRCALYLARWLPDSYATFRLRRFTYVPQRLINYCAREYIYSEYNNLTQVSGDMYDWYQRDVLQSWRYPKLVALITVMATLIAAYRVKSTYNYKAQSMVDEGHHVMPEPDPDELKRRAHWVRQMKLGEFPHSGSTVSEYDINNQCALNTVRISVWTDDDIQYKANAFIVHSNIFVTPAHFFDSTKRSIVRVRMDRLNKAGEVGTIEFPMDASSYFVDTKRDLMFFKSNRVLPGRNMVKFLRSVKDEVHINAPGRLHFFPINPLLGMDSIELQRITTAIACSPYMSTVGPQGATDCVQAYGPIGQSFDGLCGSPALVFQGHNKMVVGVHCAGDKKGGYIIRSLFIEDITNAVARLGLNVVCDNDSDLAYNAETKAMAIVETHPKCPSHDLKKGEMVVIGGSTLPRARFHTDVGRSPIYKEVYDFFSKDNEFFTIPWDSPISCDPKKAILLSMEKAVQNADFFPNEIAIAVKEMSDEFIGKMSRERLNRLHPYPWSVAVNGVDGIPYLERLNLKTAGGHGHPGPKKKLFDIIESTAYHQVRYEMNDILWDEVKWIYDQYMIGNEANPVFKCSFKDEPISDVKIKQNKVRIFSGSPTAFSILTRKYLLCIIREFVGSHRLDFEMAIGANAHGMDWDEIYHKVIKHGVHRCFAGDYKAFDKQMSPEMILAAFEVIKNILRASGNYTEDDFRVISGIATDTAFPTMDMFGTYVQFYGSNPSGHVLTTPINSLVNSLYMRMAVKRILIKTHDVLPIFGNVMSLVTYGDDNCGSTSEYYPEVNHTSIQEALAEVGIVYTSDDKTSESKGLTHVDHVTFLKRHFRYIPELARMGAPLLEESLIKALSVWTYSRSIDKKEQLAAVIDSVNREFFFHGKVIFEKMHLFLKNCAIKHNVVLYLPNEHLSSWDEIYQHIRIC